MDTIYGVHMVSFPPSLAMVGDDRLGRGTVNHERDSGLFVAGMGEWCVGNNLGRLLTGQSPGQPVQILCHS